MNQEWKRGQKGEALEQCRRGRSRAAAAAAQQRTTQRPNAARPPRVPRLTNNPEVLGGPSAAQAHARAPRVGETAVFAGQICIDIHLQRYTARPNTSPLPRCAAETTAAPSCRLSLSGRAEIVLGDIGMQLKSITRGRRVHGEPLASRANANAGDSCILLNNALQACRSEQGMGSHEPGCFA